MTNLRFGCAAAEVPAQQGIVDRCAGSFAFASFLDVRGLQFLPRIQPPFTAFSNPDAGPLELMNQKPVVKRCFIAVSVEHGTDGVGVLRVPEGERIIARGVESLR